MAVTQRDERTPSLLLDAGTGIREVTALLAGQPFRGTVMLTHLHWDHLQGLPFFAAADRSGARTRLLLPCETGDDPTDLLARAMSPPHFPIGPEGLHGAWCIERLEAGLTRVGGLRVRTAEIPHKGGVTYGLRVEDENASFAYLPDHLPDPRGARAAGVRQLIAGVDLLIHDAQFLTAESTIARDYGHSTVRQAVDLAVAGGVGELALFHHAPGRTDDQLDELLADARRSSGAVLITAAVDGEHRDLCG